MPEPQINFLAVLICGVVYMAIGALWYSPILFGKLWMKGMGWTEESFTETQKKGVWRSYLISFIGALVTAFVLTHFVQYAAYATGETGVRGGLQAGFWAWLGFVLPIMATGWAYEGKTVSVFLIGAAYHLVTTLAMGAILAAWL